MCSMAAHLISIAKGEPIVLGGTIRSPDVSRQPGLVPDLAFGVRCTVYGDDETDRAVRNEGLHTTPRSLRPGCPPRRTGWGVHITGA